MTRGLLNTETAVARMMDLVFRYSALAGRRSGLEDEIRLILQSHALSTHLKLKETPIPERVVGPKLDTMVSEFLIPCPHCDRPVRIRALAE